MLAIARGVFAIPPTPFTDEGALDEDSLRRTVQFCLSAGVHGLVTPVNASEFTSLTDDERRRVVQTVVRETGGRVPVVAGVAGGSLEHAVSLTFTAREVGADAVIALPPSPRVATEQQIALYYTAIAAAAGDLPVWIQNDMPPTGTPMSPQFLAHLVDEIPGVDYIKEECIPPGQRMTATFALVSSKLKGIMSGMAGRFMMDDFRRGACGTMPACEIADVHVGVWNLLESGDECGARELFDAMVPLLNFEALHSVAVYKEVLVRRGVIKSAYMRDPGRWALDRSARLELDAILERLAPRFRVSL
jgi:4-hydroxy-tetrahydrodipicolinate synthase